MTFVSISSVDCGDSEPRRREHFQAWMDPKTCSRIQQISGVRYEQHPDPFPVS